MQDVRAAVEAAAEVLTGRRIAVLTGAGISTDSGIPDYRGTGAPVRTPMTVERFLAQDDAGRRRYWAGGQLGWKQFAATEPNAGHAALADWERRGWSSGIVTQNVDGLHSRAGSSRVVELHGAGRRIVCIDCGQMYDRRALSERIERDNPWIRDVTDVELGPDGDVLPARTDDFVVPVCTVCGGMLRPDVVFFGEYIPAERFRAAEGIVADADALVIAGTSLTVNSGIRILERARRRALPVVIVNRGGTRADARATLAIDGGTSEILPALTAALQKRQAA